MNRYEKYITKYLQNVKKKLDTLHKVSIIYSNLKLKKRKMKKITFIFTVFFAMLFTAKTHAEATKYLVLTSEKMNFFDELGIPSTAKYSWKMQGVFKLKETPAAPSGFTITHYQYDMKIGDADTLIMNYDVVHNGLDSTGATIEVKMVKYDAIDHVDGIMLEGIQIPKDSAEAVHYYDSLHASGFFQRGYKHTKVDRIITFRDVRGHTYDISDDVKSLYIQSSNFENWEVLLTKHYVQISKKQRHELLEYITDDIWRVVQKQPIVIKELVKQPLTVELTGSSHRGIETIVYAVDFLRFQNVSENNQHIRINGFAGDTVVSATTGKLIPKLLFSVVAKPNIDTIMRGGNYVQVVRLQIESWWTKDGVEQRYPDIFSFAVMEQSEIRWSRESGGPLLNRLQMGNVKNELNVVGSEEHSPWCNETMAYLFQKYHQQFID